MTLEFTSEVTKMNQGQYIRFLIEKFMEQGYKDKYEIYDQIQKGFNFPRPTIRRVANSMLQKMIEKVRILDSNIEQKLEDIICPNCGKKIGKGIIIPDNKAFVPKGAYCSKCWEKHADV